MNCRKCGSSIDSGAKFCQNCGLEFNNQISTKPVFSDVGEEGHPVLKDSTQEECLSTTSNIPIDQSHLFLGGIYHPWRRFFARTTDLVLLGYPVVFLVFMLVAVAFPFQFDGIVSWFDNPVYGAILLYLPWIPFEAALLSATGTTLGKWVFGIRVSAPEGQRLSYRQALKRTCLLWFQGAGLGIPIVSLFTHYSAYHRLTSSGTTLWDTSVNATVTHEKWGVLRTVGSVLFVFFTMMVYGYVNSTGEV